MRKDAKRKLTRQGAIYRIALAGICSALSLLLVWLSVVARYGTLGFFVAAGIVLMIPLSKKYYLSAFFAYAVSAGLSFLVGDIASIIGYVIYFGPMALLVGIFANKNVKLFISLPIQACYTVGALALLYFVFGSVVVSYDALFDVDFWIIATVGTVVLLTIDVVEWFAYRFVVPRISKVLRDYENIKNSDSNSTYIDENDDSPFEEFDTFVVPLTNDDKADSEKKGSDRDDLNDEDKR